MTERLFTAADRKDAIDFVYSKSFWARRLIRRTAQNKLILSQIAESVLKSCTQMNATQNTEDIQARCQAPLKDAVTFWPLVIQLLLPILIRLIIDFFINKQSNERAT